MASDARSERLRALACSPFPWLALLYLLTAKGHLEMVDTEYSVRTAIAIVEEGSMLIEVVDPAVLEIAPEVAGTEKIYSQYGLGLVGIFLPLVVVGKGIATVTGLEQRVPIDYLLSFYNIPFALLGLWFFRSILTRLGAGGGLRVEGEDRIVTRAVGCGRDQARRA